MTQALSPDSLFIFDVDGVITDPHTKIPNPHILHFIAGQLCSKKPVAIGTGRSASWLQEHLIPLIAAQVPNELLDYLFLAGEKGSVTIEFTHGDASISVDKGVSIPEDLRKKIQEKVREYPAIFDNGKQTMVSIEIEGGEDEEKVNQEKKALDALETWIREEIHPEKYHLIVERSIIALDIQQEQVSKRLVAQKFVSFLHQKHIARASFTVFGDSPSDIHIAEELHEQGFSVLFDYVGYRPLEKKYAFEIIKSEELFDQGVLTLLARHHNK